MHALRRRRLNENEVAVALEQFGPVWEARAKEYLAISDTGVVGLRRRLNQAYREAVEEAVSGPQHR